MPASNPVGQTAGAAWRWLGHVSAGGRWSDRLPHPVRRNLRWFWLDGLFAQATESISLTYLAVYVLALGATRGQIGLMSALSSLSAALLLLPGAALARQPADRQRLCLYSGSAARVIFFLMALVPLVFAGPAVVGVAIALAVVREALANLALPAWTALSADLVPLEWRGRYFGSRNMVMGLVGMGVTLLVGPLITRLGSPLGYQAALGLAFASGVVSLYSFAQLRPPADAPSTTPGAGPTPPAPGGLAPAALWKGLRARPAFLGFCATAALWNFSLNIAGPFFYIFLVQELRGSATMVGLLSAVASLAGLPGQRLFGPLTDRWGPRRVQLLTSLLIPLLPLAWVPVTAAWQPLFINLVSGFLWAGFSLSSFNALLELAPDDQRPAYTAVYQIVVLAALAAGAAVGGWVVSLWGYRMVFLLSAIGRFAAALLFARVVPIRPIPAREA